MKQKKSKGSFLIFKISLEVFQTLFLCTVVKTFCVFTSTDVEFVLAEDLITHCVMLVCLNRVPENDIQITKK